MTQQVRHQSVDEREAAGRSARTTTPLDAHQGWTPAGDRPDPVSLLEAQVASRVPDLVPVRHGRMMVSPFTFYRGAATVMAADLARTPTAGLDAQLCGDAHPLELRALRLTGADPPLRPQRLGRDPPRSVRVRREADVDELHHRRSQQRLLFVGHPRCDARVGRSHTLARAHARSGDPVAIASYLGKKDRFDRSITDFSERYADQNEKDYEAFTEAIRSGRLQAVEGV